MSASNSRRRRPASDFGLIIETEDDVSEKDPTPHPDDPPVVLSPGDSDAPDAPAPDTVYPSEQGSPGEADE